MAVIRISRVHSGYLKILKFLLILFVIWNFFHFISFLYQKSLQNDLLKVKKLYNQLQKPKKFNKIILLESGLELDDGLTEEALKYRKQLNLTNPGELGKAVEWNTSLETEEHRKLMEKSWEEYGLNAFVSSLISLNRIAQDNRSDYCRERVYSKDLPKASIVFTFYNESWSVLIRMLHSILINTPWHLIEEIIMVDDFSDKEHLLKPLDDYVAKLKKVKVLRSHTRLGVSAGRVLGFRNAKGPIIASLDGNVEVAPGWLEPLLDRLKNNPTLATYSGVKVAHVNDFHLEYDDVRKLAAFNLNQLQFTSPDIKTYQPELNIWEPHRSPILLGMVFVFWKDFGEKIGYIDVEFDMWGGDDNEFSLKTWLCGGSIELVPCSVVFHFEKQHRYEEVTKGGNSWNCNRIVESWYNEEFKKYYYRDVPEAVGKPYGNISKNIELKKKLKCHDFDWYVKNVYPDIHVRDEIKDENWLKDKLT